MSSTSKLLKAFLRLLVLLGVVRFLIVGVSDSENGGRRTGNMKHHLVEVNMGRRGKHRVLSKFELNYISKRKVPNGPDPIHNSGNSYNFAAIMTFINLM
ncbi:hypothetical protein Pfo_024097 [Paulownia fortunei]|nr:hypothetical protein Pfo_024097 [Paulownia fortunei]